MIDGDYRDDLRQRTYEAIKKAKEDRKLWVQITIQGILTQARKAADDRKFEVDIEIHECSKEEVEEIKKFFVSRQFMITGEKWANWVQGDPPDTRHFCMKLCW